MDMSGLFSSGDFKKWARVSERAAREAESAGRTEEAAGHRAEAKSWRAGRPQSDSRVPRSR